MQPVPNQHSEARPVPYRPVARQLAAGTFPHIILSRADAALDLVIMLPLLGSFTFALGASNIPSVLIEIYPEFGLFGTNVIIGVFAILLVVACLLLREQSPTIIGLNKPNAVRFWLAVALGLPVCYAASFIGVGIYAALFQPSLDDVTQDKLDLFHLVSDFPTALILPFTVFVGIHEEVYFRGFMLSRLRSLVRSDIFAILACGIIFGLAHSYQGTIGIFQTSVIGMGLAAIAVYSRTLWPAIIIHAAFDTISLVAMPYLQKFIEDFSEQAGPDTAPAIVSFLVTWLT